MTRGYYLTGPALNDMEEVWGYIGQDNPAAADRVETAIYDACAKLAENPHLGHVRSEITKKNVRFWSVYSYHVIYDPESSPLIILRVLSGWRDLAHMLDDEL